MIKFLSLFPVLALVACQTAAEQTSGFAPERLTDSDRIHHLEQLTQDEIDALDREKSIFVLTFGILEEHGPALPIGTDYYRAIGIRNRLINRLHDAHPDYAFVLFPVVPLGVGGANDLARQPDHIGTYSVRYESLRNIAMDLGGTIARKGFRNIFIIEAHGDQLHNVALNQAADYVSETYDVRMVNITSMSKSHAGSTEVLDEFLGEGWQARSGFEGHAGASETSETLAVEGGEYVEPNYSSLEPFYVDGFRGFLLTYELDGWRGYWGDPARASAELGEALIEQRVTRAVQIAELALRGDDLGSMPRYPDNLDNPDYQTEMEQAIQRALERYKMQHDEIERWLEQNPLPSREQ